ncbi:Hypothetical protein NCS54_00886000 [Fusarium falciforme]|uniref:Hypothetical protein n=1 Tax=Fusarium falciforme TaxID=195108 RepID=UPI002301DD83|nr:Hypothetical protein NCS54_00886000 [Fusarium falciforme]WAO91393.1 Hypothetical protein NCS54_00886000 [Fusarium falciforme]
MSTPAPSIEMSPPQSLPPDAFDNNGYKAITAAVVGLFFATLASALRFYVRVAIVRKLGLDDWALAVTWTGIKTLLMGVGITAALVTRSGLGRHIYVLDSKDIISFDLSRAAARECINRLLFWYINSTVNIITDIIIYIVPLPLLRTLPIRKFQKIVPVGVFSLGFL